jgi:hypothetical protein
VQGRSENCKRNSPVALQRTDTRRSAQGLTTTLRPAVGRLRDCAAAPAGKRPYSWTHSRWVQLSSCPMPLSHAVCGTGLASGRCLHERQSSRATAVTVQHPLFLTMPWSAKPAQRELRCTTTCSSELGAVSPTAQVLLPRQSQQWPGYVGKRFGQRERGVTSLRCFQMSAPSLQMCPSFIQRPPKV